MLHNELAAYLLRIFIPLLNRLLSQQFSSRDFFLKVIAISVAILIAEKAGSLLIIAHVLYNANDI